MAYLTNTTRPKGRSSIRCRRASAASSSLYARSRIGFTLPELSSGKLVAHAAALTICDCANREKPLMLARFQPTQKTALEAAPLGRHELFEHPRVPSLLGRHPGRGGF